MPENANNSGNNRMVLLLIAGLPVTMILAATWLWFFVAKGDLDLVGALGTANRGALVQPPRQIDDATMLDPGGRPARYADHAPRWTMLAVAAGGACDVACEHTLYLTRQIHTALGKEYNRVRRILVTDLALAAVRLDVEALSDGRPAPPDLAGLMASEHHGTEVLQLAGPALQQMFPEHGADDSTWYLVDPAGWIMMSYNSETPYKDVIADMKFLLKNSSG